MQVFAASDIVEVAIRIEENGINFYKFAEQIAKEQWRVAFEELDQTLRCSHCKHSDVDIPD